jgi:hypothetical protein
MTKIISINLTKTTSSEAERYITALREVTTILINQGYTLNIRRKARPRKTKASK